MDHDGCTLQWIHSTPGCVLCRHVPYKWCFFLYRNPYHLAKVLRDIRPRYIVIYDAEIQFVRQIEVRIISLHSHRLLHKNFVYLIGLQGWYSWYANQSVFPALWQFRWRAGICIYCFSFHWSIRWCFLICRNISQLWGRRRMLFISWSSKEQYGML